MGGWVTRGLGVWGDKRFGGLGDKRFGGLGDKRVVESWKDNGERVRGSGAAVWRNRGIDGRKW